MFLFTIQNETFYGVDHHLNQIYDNVESGDPNATQGHLFSNKDIIDEIWEVNHVVDQHNKAHVVESFCCLCPFVLISVVVLIYTNCEKGRI